MESLRKLSALILTLALANYGVVATAVHAHEHSGFHQVHVLLDGDHDDGRHQGAPEHEPEEADRNSGAPAHTETGFHSHSSPQFGPADASVMLAVAIETGRPQPPDPDSLFQRHRDRPPFKPPRILL